VAREQVGDMNMTDRRQRLPVCLRQAGNTLECSSSCSLPALEPAATRLMTNCPWHCPWALPCPLALVCWSTRLPAHLPVAMPAQMTTEGPLARPVAVMRRAQYWVMQAPATRARAVVGRKKGPPDPSRAYCCS
jgi:hypothetical protein